MKNAIVIALLLAATRTAWADRHAALADLEAREPSLAQVRRAALRYAGLADRAESRWARRARLSGLLPTLTVELETDRESDIDLSRSSAGTQQLAVGSDRDISVEAKAVWHLDRLLFSDVELRAAKGAQQRHNERLQLVARVTSLYFQRRKLQVARIWSPSKSPDKAAMHELAVDELTAQLDALTGGYFSSSLTPGRGH